MIAEFKGGPKQLLARMNEFIRLLRAVSNLRGDQYIVISRNEGGTAIGLNIEQVMARIPKTITASPIHKAYCQANAGSGTTISCRLDTNTAEATTVTVTCEICGGGSLSSAIPLLETGDLIYVSAEGTTYRCIQAFQAAEVCT